MSILVENPILINLHGPTGHNQRMKKEILFYFVCPRDACWRAKARRLFFTGIQALNV